MDAQDFIRLVHAVETLKTCLLTLPELIRLAEIGMNAEMLDAEIELNLEDPEVH